VWQGLEAIGLQQSGQITDGLLQLWQVALVMVEAQLPHRGRTHQHRGVWINEQGLHRLSEALRIEPPPQQHVLSSR
jgi:hypothetical protein